MTEYRWWADPELATLSSAIGVIVGFAVVWLILALRGDL
jgi:hypothetical protein